MKRFIFAVFVLFGMGATVCAQASELFRATIIAVEEHADGAVVKQRLTLENENGDVFDIAFEEDVEIVSQNTYEVGDEVYAFEETDIDGNTVYRIADYNRLPALGWLAALFFASVAAVSRWKGVKSLFVLLLTFIIILQFIIPRIIAGNDPVLISVIGGIVIVGLAIFITEGYTKKSKVAFGSVLITLLFVLGLTAVFPEYAKLTGMGSEEALVLSGLDGVTVNIKGLLLAGMIIVSLGVIDDLILTQVSVVEELCSEGTCYNKKELFTRAMSVGQSHVSAMINTLFFAYAGAALPLLVVFSTGVSGNITFLQAVNLEFIAIEVVRTFIGSISMVLAVPVATWLAVRRYVEA